eukprot:scaffold2539_cov388-Prasinococcus_capsulatus_cf.AAC.8
MNTLASSFVGLRLGSSSFNGATSRLQGKSSSTSGPTVLPVTSKCSDVLLSPAALHSQPERNKSVREYGSMTGPASGFVCRERACGISVSGAYLGAVSLGRGLRRRLAQLQFVRVAQATKSVYCVGTSVVGKLSSFLVDGTYERPQVYADWKEGKQRLPCDILPPSHPSPAARKSPVEEDMHQGTEDHRCQGRRRHGEGVRPCRDDGLAAAFLATRLLALWTCGMRRATVAWPLPFANSTVCLCAEQEAGIDLNNCAGTSHVLASSECPCQAPSLLLEQCMARAPPWWAGWEPGHVSPANASPSARALHAASARRARYARAGARCARHAAHRSLTHGRGGRSRRARHTTFHRNVLGRRSGRCARCVARAARGGGALIHAHSRGPSPLAMNRSSDIALSSMPSLPDPGASRRRPLAPAPRRGMRRARCLRRGGESQQQQQQQRPPSADAAPPKRRTVLKGDRTPRPAADLRSRQPHACRLGALRRLREHKGGEQPHGGASGARVVLALHSTSRHCASGVDSLLLLLILAANAFRPRFRKLMEQDDVVGNEAVELSVAVSAGTEFVPLDFWHGLTKSFGAVSASPAGMGDVLCA